jgi:two-component system KDP operon response regulator KdpE
VTVLVVEDEPAVAEILATALRARGNVVEVAATGREALHLASVLEPDLVVLDLGLPDIDGVEVCAHLRRWFLNPIVVLSADGDEQRKIAALDGGADDYVTKPFSMPELLARVRVAMRHREAVSTALDPAGLVIGALHLDTAAHHATIVGVPLRLAPKEFALLAVLARNCGRVLTHSALLSHVWGSPDPAKTRALRGLVTQLRKQLGEGPDRPRILTDAGVGYRLLAPEGVPGASRREISPGGRPA